jgi:hypothetical protein
VARLAGLVNTERKKVREKKEAKRVAQREEEADVIQIVNAPKSEQLLPKRASFCPKE